MQTYSVRLLFFTSLLVLSIAAAASAGPLTGRIVQPDNTAAGGVTVFLTKDINFLTSTTTDRDGGFRLVAPDQGPYELRVATYGFTLTPLQLSGEAAARNVGALTLSIAAQSESVLVSAAASKSRCRPHRRASP